MSNTKKIFLGAIAVILFGALTGFLGGQFGPAAVGLSTLVGGGVGLVIDALAGGLVYLYYEVIDELVKKGKAKPDDKEFGKVPFFIALGCLSVGSLIGYLSGFFSSMNMAVAVLVGAGVGAGLAVLTSALFLGILLILSPSLNEL